MISRLRRWFTRAPKPTLTDAQVREALALIHELARIRCVERTAEWRRKHCSVRTVAQLEALRDHVETESASAMERLRRGKAS